MEMSFEEQNSTTPLDVVLSAEIETDVILPQNQLTKGLSHSDVGQVMLKGTGTLAEIMGQREAALYFKQKEINRRKQLAMFLDLKSARRRNRYRYNEPNIK